jgi:hypothetical protein
MPSTMRISPTPWMPLADLIYVAIGTAVALGVDLRPVWDAVHAANLAKAGGPRRADGKFLKSADWVHPDIKGILAKQITFNPVENLTQPTVPISDSSRPLPLFPVSNSTCSKMELLTI